MSDELKRGFSAVAADQASIREMSTMIAALRAQLAAAQERVTELEAQVAWEPVPDGAEVKGVSQDGTRDVKWKYSGWWIELWDADDRDTLEAYRIPDEWYLVRRTAKEQRVSEQVKWTDERIEDMAWNTLHKHGVLSRRDAIEMLKHLRADYEAALTATQQEAEQLRQEQDAANARIGELEVVGWEQCDIDTKPNLITRAQFRGITELGYVLMRRKGE